jgi:hypothetical protein
MWDQDEDIEMVQKHKPDDCPFCRGEGMLRNRWITKQGERSGPNYTKRKLWYFSCVMCGAQGGVADTPGEALDNWNRRPTRSWQPLPDDTVSFLLPGGQKYQHLMILEAGKVRLIDYIEPECTEDGSGVAAQVDVDLGRFRVCLLREAYVDDQEERLTTTVEEGRDEAAA